VLSPTQLAADLRPAFRGELFIDVATRAVYSGVGSPFQVVPLAVAVPKNEADLQTVVETVTSLELASLVPGA
jgi:hypothetical protein